MQPRNRRRGTSWNTIPAFLRKHCNWKRYARSEPRLTRQRENRRSTSECLRIFASAPTCRESRLPGAYPVSANSYRLYRVSAVEDDALCGHICLCPHRGIVDTLSQPTQATTAKTRSAAEPLKSDGTSWRQHWCLGLR